MLAQDDGDGNDEMGGVYEEGTVVSLLVKECLAGRRGVIPDL